MKKNRENHKPEHRETISGVLTPAGWDDEGQVTEVMLSAIDDEEYLIENSEKFIDLVHQNIEASGVIRRDRKSFRTINIKRFILVDPPSPEKTEDGWMFQA